MSFEDGNEYKDVGIAAKVHAAHIESQATSVFDSQRAFARISHKMKSKYMERLSDQRRNKLSKSVANFEDSSQHPSSKMFETARASIKNTADTRVYNSSAISNRDTLKMTKHKSKLE